MRRLVGAVVLTGAMGLGLSLEAHAQALIMPTGPLAVMTLAETPVPTLEESGVDQVYPGRTMGGGTRILRSIPPPSFLKRRREE